MDGTPRWHVKYPKATGGKPVACTIMEPAKHGKFSLCNLFCRNEGAWIITVGYVKKLLDTVITEAVSAPPKDKENAIPVTRSSLSSWFRNVLKDIEVTERVNRFNRQRQNHSERVQNKTQLFHSWRNLLSAWCVTCCSKAGLTQVVQKLWLEHITECYSWG